MSVKKFRFVSPGIFISEIDNSQMPRDSVGIGPVLIGRAMRGPAMRPIQVTSFSEFIEVFGNPVPGGKGGDVFRDGNYTAPTYAAYAAQAYLKNSAPLTFVRLLGTEHEDRDLTSSLSQGGYATLGEPNAAGDGGDDWSSEHGGAFGLFVAEEAADASAALAAVIYVENGTVGLTGADPDGDLQGNTNGTTQGVVSHWVKATGTDAEFKLTFSDVNSAGEGDPATFSNHQNKTINFGRTSKKFIRRVLNTNPTLCNSDISSAGERAYLGESYERHLEDIVDLSEDTMAIILPLSGDNYADKHDLRMEMQSPVTSWVMSQDTGEHEDFVFSAGSCELPTTNLFRFHGLDDGDWTSQNLKVSIADIKAADDDYNPYGTFTVILRRQGDSDQAPRYVERYTGINLNPNSSDYISRRIGDMKTVWSYQQSRYQTLGQWPNYSKFVRVEVNPEIENGTADPALVPFGFYGPAMPRPVGLAADASEPEQLAVAGSDLTTPAVLAGEDAAQNAAAGDGGAGATGLGGTFNLVFPAMATRGSSSQGRLASGQQAYFGASANLEGTSKPDPSFADLCRPYSANHADGAPMITGDGDVECIPQLQSGGVCGLAGEDGGDPQWGASDQLDGNQSDLARMHNVDGSTDNALNLETIRNACGEVVAGSGIVAAFTLDDLVLKTSPTNGAGTTFGRIQKHADWMPGSRFAGLSVSVKGSDVDQGSYDDDPAVRDLPGPGLEKTGSYKTILDLGFDQFTLPLVGGFDGVNIKEREPFRNTILSEGGDVENSAFNSVKRAIDCIADPEVVEYNLAAIPGITNAGLTGHLLDVCERRADALAVIDLVGDYVSKHEGTQDEANRVPDVDVTVQTLKDRGINSSYGCAYFPWVQIRDTISDAVLWSPPSVVALGTMGSSAAKSEVWFAPAGFNRGGLTEGSAGIPVTQVRRRLTSKERDKLYEANINPIASFPSEGLVIFGQKTLQVTPSALDRINVRRLMIYLKKEVSRISAGILFDQNVQTTWQRFTSQVEPLLASVKNRFGLSDFRVILDETTTTPDLVDRNIMYAKIMLKPARAIEFIAIDFVITRSGASFDD